MSPAARIGIVRRWRHGMAAAASMALLLPAAAQACEKSLRWYDDPPFSMRRADGQVVGLQIELNAEILQRMGCTVRLLEMPWARALQELAAGRLDLLPGAFRRPEREVYAYFSAPVLTSRNMLFMHRDALRRWPIKQLTALRNSGFRLGVQIDVSYGPDYQLLMQDTGFASHVQKVSQRRNLWRMLSLGRIDGVIADELTGRHEIAEAGLSAEILMSPVVVSSDSSATAFSKNSNTADVVAAYDRALASMRKDGSYQALLHKYGASAP